LLKSAGIEIPAGFVARHSNVIPGRAKCMIPRLAVKAGAHPGGRGKVGAVRPVHSSMEAGADASAMRSTLNGKRPPGGFASRRNASGTIPQRFYFPS
jgi:succinyl-CoA synthetase beta subunit